MTCWLPSPRHGFCHRGLADIDAKLEQFAVDPRCSPKRVRDAHVANPIRGRGQLFWVCGTDTGTTRPADGQSIRRHSRVSNPWRTTPSIRPNLVFGSDRRDKAALLQSSTSWPFTPGLMVSALDVLGAQEALAPIESPATASQMTLTCTFIPRSSSGLPA
jgi:hypothetical protein